MHIRLRPVALHDWQFLYDLLAERPKMANISHKEMPSIADHIGFLKSEPYQAWYIIEHNHASAGTVYLTKQNEIGIQVSEGHQRQGIATAAIAELMKQHPKPSYLANIAPYNWQSHNLFTGMGFHLIQNTYALEPNA